MKRAKGGKPPKFSGDGLTIHDIVKQEMKRVYHERSLPVYLNNEAKSILKEGFDNFHSLNLDKTAVLQIGNTVHVFPWLGDKIVNTITILIRQNGLSANCFGGIIDINNASSDDFFHAVNKILNGPQISPTELAEMVPDTIVEKHDYFLPREIREISYGAKFFDVDGAMSWLSTIKP